MPADHDHWPTGHVWLYRCGWLGASEYCDLLVCRLRTANLRTKLIRRGLGGDVITQFGFDAAQVLAWLTEVRARGIGVPVRVSVPGPTTERRLLAIASRCGVAVSASVAEECGFSLTEPTRTAGPGRFVQTLASGYDPWSHGDAKLHFNAFGGFRATVEWIESRVL